MLGGGAVRALMPENAENVGLLARRDALSTRVGLDRGADTESSSMTESCWTVGLTSARRVDCGHLTCAKRERGEWRRCRTFSARKVDCGHPPCAKRERGECGGDEGEEEESRRAGNW